MAFHLREADLGAVPRPGERTAGAPAFGEVHPGLRKQPCCQSFSARAPQRTTRLGYSDAMAPFCPTVAAQRMLRSSSSTQNYFRTIEYVRLSTEGASGLGIHRLSSLAGDGRDWPPCVDWLRRNLSEAHP